MRVRRGCTKKRALGVDDLLIALGTQLGRMNSASMTAAWLVLHAACCTTAQQQDLSSVGARGDNAAVCALGYYDHDEDASTACLACPAGKYSQSPGAVSRPELDAGAGNLALSVDNGDTQRLFAMGDNSDNPHPDGGWNFATTTCYFDECIAECSCAVDCDNLDGMCGIPPLVYTLPDFSGMNGVRRCGATSQASVAMVGVFHACSS